MGIKAVLRHAWDGRTRGLQFCCFLFICLAFCQAFICLQRQGCCPLHQASSNNCIAILNRYLCIGAIQVCYMEQVQTLLFQIHSNATKADLLKISHDMYSKITPKQLSMCVLRGAYLSASQLSGQDPGLPQIDEVTILTCTSAEIREVTGIVTLTPISLPEYTGEFTWIQCRYSIHSCMLSYEHTGINTVNSIRITELYFVFIQVKYRPVTS